MRPVVIIPGSNHQPEHYSKIVSALGDTGAKIVVPYVGMMSVPDSVSHLQGIVDGFDEPPVVLAHSFGGVAGGSLHDIAHLVLIAAFLLETDETSSSFVGREPDAPESRAMAAALMPTSQDKTLYAVKPELAGDLFFNECDEASTRWGVSLLRSEPAQKYGEHPPAAAWKNVPTTYIRMSRDHTWPPRLAEEEMHRADEVVHLHGGHSHFVQSGEPYAQIVRPLLSA